MNPTTGTSQVGAGGGLQMHSQEDYPTGTSQGRLVETWDTVTRGRTPAGQGQELTVQAGQMGPENSSQGLPGKGKNAADGQLGARQTNKQSYYKQQQPGQGQ